MLKPKPGFATAIMWYLLALSSTMLLPLYNSNGATPIQDRKTISGTAKDSETGEAILGASVTVKGTNVGTTTNANGEFSLQASVGDELMITFVGYIPNSIVISETNTYSVTLTSQAEQLMEVVVVGSRNLNRTVIDSPVPIDIIEPA